MTPYIALYLASHSKGERMIKFKMVLSESVTIAELGGTEYWINWESGTTIIMHPGWTGLRATFGVAF